MKIEFTRHIFATFTYSRDQPVQDRWKTISKDYNRVIQRFSRLHGTRLNYLRVIEEHRDSYPHIHAIIQFPDARIRVENARYFDKKLYARWKGLWKDGHSDYQKPRSIGHGPISYLMKYLVKNQTQKTIWKKILPSTIINVKLEAAQEKLPPYHKESSPSQSVTSTPSDTNTGELSEEKIMPIRLNGTKLCTWSRNFDWTPFTKTQDN